MEAAQRAAVGCGMWGILGRAGGSGVREIPLECRVPRAACVPVRECVSGVRARRAMNHDAVARAAAVQITGYNKAVTSNNLGTRSLE